MGLKDLIILVLLVIAYANATNKKINAIHLKLIKAFKEEIIAQGIIYSLSATHLLTFTMPLPKEIIEKSN